MNEELAHQTTGDETGNGDLATAFGPIDTLTLLVELGFVPANTAGGPGLALDVGPVSLQALRCIGPRFSEIVLLTGNFVTSRSIGMVEHHLPVEIESRELGLALLARCLKACQIPADQEPGWLIAGRQHAHLLPWNRCQAAYAARPRCSVSRNWLRLALRTLAEGVVGRNPDQPVRFEFDGKLLTIIAGETVVAMPAAGEAWVTAYELAAGQMVPPPARFIGSEVEISVYEGAMTMGRRRYSHVVERPIGRPTQPTPSPR